jgi:hypothetical protein
MRRLLQGRETIDPAESRLVDLVRATEKTSVNPFRKRAILHRLQSGARSTGILRPWAGGVAGVLLVGTATAGTVSWWREREPTAHPAAQVIAAAPAVVAPPGPAAPSAADTPLEVAADPTPATSRVHPAAPTRTRVKSSGEDPTAVMQAIRALRTDHDPWRAEDLLQSYLQHNPRGALAEEALALQIEAARARHDAVASERASRYLRLYPNGAYRKAAENALHER